MDKYRKLVEVICPRCKRKRTVGIPRKMIIADYTKLCRSCTIKVAWESGSFKSGETSPYWKGGRVFRKKDGYFMIHISNVEDKSFEIGADAMLEALFKLAKESPTGTFVIDSREIHIYLGKE